MAKEDETLFGQKLEEVGVSIYDKLLVQTERIGRELDKKLFAVCADFVKWHDQFPWIETVTTVETTERPGETFEWARTVPLEYRIETTTPDGKKGLIETSHGVNILLQERRFDGKVRSLGTTVFINPYFSYLLSRENIKLEDLFPTGKVNIVETANLFPPEPIGVAFISPGNTIESRAAHHWLYHSSDFGASNSFEDALSGYAWLQEERGRYMRRERHIGPVDPIEKAREIVDMLKRGKVTHKFMHTYKKGIPIPVWQPV